MSTILDALRKVERERRRRESGGDLGQTIVTDDGETPPESSGSRRWIWIAVTAGVLFGLGLYGALLLRGEEPSVPVSQVQASVPAIPKADPARLRQSFGRRVARASAQGAPGRTRPAPKLPPAQVKGLTASTPRSESASAGVVAAAAPASPPPKPKSAQASPKPSKEEPRKERPRAVKKRRAKRPPPAAVPDKKPAPEPQKKAPAVVDKPKAAAVVEPSPRAKAVEPPPPFVPTVAPKEEDAAIAKPVVPDEPDEEEILSPVGFPVVQVHNVRWHPDPQRRSAEVRIDRAGPLMVREGEIVAGLLVETIRPGRVVLQLGGRVRSFNIEP